VELDYSSQHPQLGQSDTPFLGEELGQPVKRLEKNDAKELLRPGIELAIAHKDVGAIAGIAPTEDSVIQFAIAL
jgi:hypothetical protein